MKVKFVPQNVEFDIKTGESVLHVAQDHGIYIKSVCKGVPSCAECRVRVVDGEHNVLPPGSEELSLIGTGHFIDRRRLSCQLKCFGDITVDLTDQIAKQEGLNGRKHKQISVKDDRIEEVRAIRGEGFDSPSSDGEDAEGEEQSRSRRPSPQRSQPPSRQQPRPSQGGASVGGSNSRPHRPPQGNKPAAGAEGGQEGGGKRTRRRRRGGGGGGGGNAQNSGRGPSGAESRD